MGRRSFLRNTVILPLSSKPAHSPKLWAEWHQIAGREEARFGSLTSWAHFKAGQPSSHEAKGSVYLFWGIPLPTDNLFFQGRYKISRVWALQTLSGREHQGEKVVLQGWCNKLTVSSCCSISPHKYPLNFRVPAFHFPLLLIVPCLFLSTYPSLITQSHMSDLPTSSCSSLCFLYIFCVWLTSQYLEK